MSTKARYIGDPDGAEIEVPLANGEIRNLHVPFNGEVPEDIDGVKVPAAFRDSLLEQEANWTSVSRDTKTKKDGDE